VREVQSGGGGKTREVWTTAGERDERHMEGGEVWRKVLEGGVVVVVGRSSSDDEDDDDDDEDDEEVVDLHGTPRDTIVRMMSLDVVWFS
jgi:hypothetical protein